MGPNSGLYLLPLVGMEIAALYILSYLVGAVPTAYLIGKLVRGLDLRTYGSGNVGGANLFYHVGKGWVVPLGVFEVLVKGRLSHLGRSVSVGAGALFRLVGLGASPCHCRQ